MKTGLLLLFLLACGQSVHAQPKLNYGLKMGVNATGERVDVYALNDRKINYRRTLGYTFGGFVSHRLYRKWTLTAELLYQKSSSKHADVARGLHWPTGNPFLREDITTYRFHSLQTPVYVTYCFSNKPITPILNLGISPAFIVGAKQHHYSYLSTTGAKQNETTPLDFANPYNANLRGELQALFGLGLRVKDRVTVALNYTIGKDFIYYITDSSVCPPNAGCDFTDLSYHNRAFTLSVSYGLNHSR